MALLPPKDQTPKSIGVTAAPRERVVVVDLSPEPAKAKVVREGYQVPKAPLDPQKAAFLVDELIGILPEQTPRVLSQSIPAGSKVTQGTTVDLVLASAEVIPFDIFENVHQDLKGRTLSSLIEGTLQSPQVRKTLLQYERAEDVPANEKQALINALSSAEVGVDEGDEQRTFKRAFDSARGALAFK
jgi:hypothetical protein